MLGDWVYRPVRKEWVAPIRIGPWIATKAVVHDTIPAKAEINGICIVNPKNTGKSKEYWQNCWYFESAEEAKKEVEKQWREELKRENS